MADYTYWAAALDMTKGRRAVTREEMKSLGLNETDVGCGFFRKRNKDKTFLPVAIWVNAADEVVALVNGRMADSAAEVWTYCAPHPITEEDYRARIGGNPWPDEDGAVTESLAHDPQNSPVDPLESMRDQIDNALKGADDYATVNDDETASKAQSLRSRLLELRGEADKKREAIVRPHLDAQTAANAVWMPLVKSAKAAADKIAAALGAHETRKENARKAAEAVRLKIEQEAEAKRIAAIEAGKPAPPPPEPVPVPPAPAPTMTVRGAYGRAASVKTVKKAKVVDQDAAYGYLKSQTELVELISALAQKAVTAGLTVPGVEVEEVKKVT